MTKKLLISITVAFIFAVSCSETVHDIDYYLKNPQERKAKLEECSKDRQKMDYDYNCRNAAAAYQKAMEDKPMPKIR